MAKENDTSKKLRKGEYQRKDGYYSYRVTIDGKRRVITASNLIDLRKKEDTFRSLYFHFPNSNSYLLIILYYF